MVDVRCEQCGKILYKITIPTEVKGTITVEGGNIESKCPRCGKIYSFGISELLKVVMDNQKTTIVEEHSPNIYYVHSRVTVPYEFLSKEGMMIMDEIKAHPKQRKQILDEFAKKHGGKTEHL